MTPWRDARLSRCSPRVDSQAPNVHPFHEDREHQSIIQQTDGMELPFESSDLPQELGECYFDDDQTNADVLHEGLDENRRIYSMDTAHHGDSFAYSEFDTEYQIDAQYTGDIIQSFETIVASNEHQGLHFNSDMHDSSALPREEQVLSYSTRPTRYRDNLVCVSHTELEYVNVNASPMGPNVLPGRLWRNQPQANMTVPNVFHEERSVPVYTMGSAHSKDKLVYSEQIPSHQSTLSPVYHQFGRPSTSWAPVYVLCTRCKHDMMSYEPELVSSRTAPVLAADCVVRFAATCEKCAANCTVPCTDCTKHAQTYPCQEKGYGVFFFWPKARRARQASAAQLAY
jgi:hypothetical protein